jgi:hypothetical protein
MNQFPSITNQRAAAIDLFTRFRHAGQLAALRSKLTGRPVHLEDFSEYAHKLQNGRSLLGMRDIPVCMITGSVGRSLDFTRDFRPLKKHLAQRWANAYLQSGLDSWPPVKVFKVGERYFVEDGHHRLSVANFLGMLDIQAEVWEYQVEPTRPAACQPASHPLAARKAETCSA